MLKECFYKLATQRAATVVDNIADMLPGDGTLLDYGCGVGYLGYEVEKRTSCRLTYLDVRPYPFMHPGIKLQCYDGKRIPCDDRAYDHSMAAFTLHHTKDAWEGLREMVRVTRKSIIICEDYIASPAHKYLEVVKDLVSNCFFTTITMQYRLVHEWEDMFSELGLSIKCKKQFKSYLIPYKLGHVAWLLKRSTDR